MRKIFLAFIFQICSVFIFSQNSFEAKILEAKKFEQDGLVIHALCSYYDAMEIEQSVRGLEAYKEFTRIEESLKNSKQSYTDDFDLYSYWIKLAIEFEEFWYDECPAYFMFSGFTKTNVDYDKFSASYGFRFSGDFTPKYRTIKNIVESAYKRNHKTGWNYFPSDWPNQSIKKSGEEGLLSLKYYNWYYDFYEIKNYNLPCYDGFYYQLDFDVLDKDGRILIENQKVLANTYSLIENADRNICKKIDRNEFVISIKSVKLVQPTGKSYWDEVLDTYVETVEETNLLKDSDVLVIYKSGESPTNMLNLIKEINAKEIKNQKNILEIQKRKTLVDEKAKSIEKEMVKVSGGVLKSNGTEFSLSDFSILKTEVTQELYELFVGKNTSKFKGSQKPIESVSWYDAIYFCNKLSVAAEKNPCYSVNGVTDSDYWNYEPNCGKEINGTIACNFNENGYRLPTSAEWEYAAREGNKNSSNYYSGGNNVGVVSWYKNNAWNNATANVATKKPNGLGIYDLSGNVWEWCWDFYVTDFTETKKINPTGPANGKYKTIRGGGFSSSDLFCGVSSIDGYVPTDSSGRIGLRFVCSGK